LEQTFKISQKQLEHKTFKRLILSAEAVCKPVPPLLGEEHSKLSNLI
jgi:hypothetical protein